MWWILSGPDRGGIRPMPLKEIHDDMSEENGGKLPGQGTEAVDSDAFMKRMIWIFFLKKIIQ